MALLPDFDTLLIMSVEPGFGGQKFIPEVLSKVRAVRKLVDAGELTRLHAPRNELASILLRGHDPTASERRARASYEYLVTLGVNPSQLEMISYGKENPAVQGTGEAVWAKNRRDDFRVIAH